MESARHGGGDVGTIATAFGLAEVYVFGTRANEFATGSTCQSESEAQSDVDIAVRPLHDPVLAPLERARQPIVFAGGR